MSEHTKKLYTCQCHAEAVTLEFNPEEQEVFITGWQMSPGVGAMSFKERIRWAWAILKTGKPFNDHIILNYDTARQISNDIYHATRRKSNGKHQ